MAASYMLTERDTIKFLNIYSKLNIILSAFDMVPAILSRSNLKCQRKSTREYPRDLSSLQENEVER